MEALRVLDAAKKAVISKEHNHFIRNATKNIENLHKRLLNQKDVEQWVINW